MKKDVHHLTKTNFNKNLIGATQAQLDEQSLTCAREPYLLEVWPAKTE